MSNVKISQINGGTNRAPVYGNDPQFEYEEGGVSYPCKLSQLLVPPPITTLKKTTAQSCANSTWTTVTWDTTAYLDDVAAFSSGSPTIMTVPTGFSRVRMSGQSIWANSGSWTAYLQCDCSRAVGPGGATAVAVDIINGNNEHGFGLHPSLVAGRVGQIAIHRRQTVRAAVTIEAAPTAKPQRISIK
jgi:hypothetical protein